MTRDDVIKSALRIIGHLDPQETPSSEDIDTGAEALNVMLKSWNNTIVGLQMWTVREAVIFPQTDKYQYTLGTADAPSATSYTTVAVESTQAAGNQIIIGSYGVGTAGDYIGIITGSTSHWTTIDTLSSSGTIHLVTSFSSTATISNNVYIFTNLMERPVDIIHARTTINSGDGDLELRRMEHDEYFSRYEKDRVGEPRRYFFDPQLDNPVFVTDWTPDDPTELIKIRYRRPFMDFDSTTDDIDAPQEVWRAIKWNLASEIAMEYGVPPGTASQIQSRAAESLIQIRSIFGHSPRTTTSYAL